MNDYPNSVKETLTALIMEMSASPALFVKNPERDFTRKRKLPFETVIQLLMSMGGNSLYKELLEAQGYSACPPWPEGHTQNPLQNGSQLHLQSSIISYLIIAFKADFLICSIPIPFFIFL